MDKDENITSKLPNIPDLPLEELSEEMADTGTLEDRSEGSTVIGIIGSGQYGGKQVESFHRLGYKTFVINCADTDLDPLHLPSDQKMWLDVGFKGTGKNMAKGTEATKKYKQKIFNRIKRLFGKVDRILIAIGGGGGMGGGSIEVLLDLAHEYLRYMGCDETEGKVGVLLTLPTPGEMRSLDTYENACKVLDLLSRCSQDRIVSPLIVIDNGKVQTNYRKLTLREFWPAVNNTVAGLIDVFNKLSALKSEFTSFDQKEFQRIFECGGCATMGVTRVLKYDSGEAISNAVENNVEETLLSSLNLATAKEAGVIAVAGTRIVETVPGLPDYLSDGFDTLNGICPDATVHRGIYEGPRDSLRMYTLIGGTEPPTIPKKK